MSIAQRHQRNLEKLTSQYAKAGYVPYSVQNGVTGSYANIVVSRINNQGDRFSIEASVDAENKGQIILFRVEKVSQTMANPAYPCMRELASVESQEFYNEHMVHTREVKTGNVSHKRFTVSYINCKYHSQVVIYGRTAGISSVDMLEMVLARMDEAGYGHLVNLVMDQIESRGGY